MFIMNVCRLLMAIVIAYLFGKLISKLKLPAILGWLIAGMIMGPHAVGLLGNSLLEAPWFNTVESLLECIVGLMIGTELIWSKMKKAGKQILVVCNFSPLVYEKHKIGVPFEGRYKEIFNSDSEMFGGTDVLNRRAKRSKKSECDGREDSIEITVPPMGIAVFSCTEEKAPVKEKASAKEKAPAKAKAPAKEKTGAKEKSLDGKKKKGNGKKA